jgi:hypothetical protein
MKTAVEWLIDEIDMQYPDINIKRKEWMIDKAKEMEKEQTEKAIDDYFVEHIRRTTTMHELKIDNKTFKQTK